jgi:cytochrome c biogenesis protein CcmG/thiol:disulfide interchange protein DsbE
VSIIFKPCSASRRNDLLRSKRSTVWTMTHPVRIAVHALPFLAVTALVAWFALALVPGRDPSAVPSALLDKPAPQIDLPSIYEGGPGFGRADLMGRATVVNVFASWCVPCRAEHPVLTQLAREHGVPLIGLNWKDKPEAARAFLGELGDPFYGVPETYVVDAAGRIRYKHVGPLSREDLDSVILPVLRQMTK